MQKQPNSWIGLTVPLINRHVMCKIEGLLRSRSLTHSPFTRSLIHPSLIHPIRKKERRKLKEIQLSRARNSLVREHFAPGRSGPFTERPRLQRGRNTPFTRPRTALRVRMTVITARPPAGSPGPAYDPSYHSEQQPWPHGAAIVYAHVSHIVSHMNTDNVPEHLWREVWVAATYLTRALATGVR